MQVVFDHLGHIPQPLNPNDPVFAMLRELVQRDRAWVKLSGFYIDSKVGRPGHADSVEVARIYAREAPQRMLWGSDWPHPTEGYDNKPDDAALFDLFAASVPDEAVRTRILVDNPAHLYQF